MRKKYLSALLFGALLFASAGTFTSCKDYDDDIDNLQTQIDKVVSDLASLKSTIDNLNVGVTSVTFDEKTGELKVTTDGQSPVTYTIKTTVDVEEIKITIDGQDLKVNGKVVGKVGDTVKVENSELTINGQPTGIKVGKYAVLDSQTDNKYTITLPDKDGNLQTIELLKSIATNITITEVDKTTSATFTSDYAIFTQINPTANSNADELQTKNGIKWGVAGSDIDWKGPKGAVKAGQLLIGQQNFTAVTVNPSNVDLSAQALKLVDVYGNVANVTVSAKPADAGDSNTNVRAASLNGKWNLFVDLNGKVTADNIGSAFAEKADPENSDPDHYVWYNKRYALSVNGNILTGYDFVIDTEAAKVTTLNSVYSSANKYDAFKTEITTGGTTESVKKYALNKDHTLSYIGADVYDYRFTIADRDVNDAEAWGITLENNVLRGTDKAAGKTIHLNVTLLGVNGSQATVKENDKAVEIPVTFGKISVASITLPESTYKVTPAQYEYSKNNNDKYASVVVNLGELFTGLSAEEAIKVAAGSSELSTADDEFAFLMKTIVNDFGSGNAFRDGTVTFYQDEKCEKKVSYDNFQANIKKIKYAKIIYSNYTGNNGEVNIWNKKATLGTHDLKFVLKDAVGNQIRVAYAPVTVTVPTIDELFEKSAAWNAAGDEVTMRLTQDGKAAMMTAYKPTGLSIDENQFIATLNVIFNNIDSASPVTKETCGGNGNLVSFNNLNQTFKITPKAINGHALRTLTAQSYVEIVPGISAFTVKSNSYKVKLTTPLDGAKMVNYDKGVETDFVVLNGGSKTFERIPADKIATGEEKTGFAFVINGANYITGGTNLSLYSYIKENLEAGWTSLYLNNASYDQAFTVNAGADAKAEFVGGVFSVKDLAAAGAEGYTATLTLKVKDVDLGGNNFVYTNIEVPIVVKK